MKIKRGSTSVRRLIFVGDSSSTTGAGLANLVHNTSGLVAYYFAGDLSNEVQITLATATLGSYTSGGFIAVDNTNMPGWYEIGIPDAALDGGNEVAIQLRGAANMVPVNIYIELDSVDYQTDAFGALKPTTAGRTLDVSAGGEAGIDLANVGSPTTVLNLSGVTIKTATDIEADTQDIQSRLPAALDAGRMVVTIGAYQTGNAPLQPTVAGRTLDVTATGAAGIDWGNVENQGATVNLAATTVHVVNSVDSASLADPIGEIWEVATSALTDPGTIGKLLADNINATISSRLAAASYTAPLNASGTASAVWDALIASYTVADSFGSRVLRTDHASAGNAAKVTSAGHVAADIHELQPAVIDNTHFAAGAIDANAIAADAIGASELAADAVAEIVAGMATQPQLVDLATMITNDGTANARFSTSALQNAPSGGGGGGTGTGARTVTITVTLSASAVEGASVRLTKAAETYVGTTNASGVVTFNVDDGTWAVAITSPNATFAGASLVVDDDETVSYSLTAISITPSPAGQMTGYWTCYSHLGVVESGVSVTMQLVDVPKGSKGLALDSRLRTVTSNGSGVAQFTNLFPGCRYKVYRGAADNKAFYVTLPEVAPADPVELGSFYGDDE